MEFGNIRNGILETLVMEIFETLEMEFGNIRNENKTLNLNSGNIGLGIWILETVDLEFGNIRNENKP